MPGQDEGNLTYLCGHRSPSWCPPTRNFLSLSKLCPPVCPGYPLSPRGWEREQGHLFNHNARVWKHLLPQPCFLKAEAAQTSPFFTVIFYSLSASSEYQSVSLSFPRWLPSGNSWESSRFWLKCTSSGEPFPATLRKARSPYS